MLLAALPPTPPAAVARCEALANSRDIRVLCPTRLPRAGWAVRYRSLERGRLAYLTDFQADGGRHHALAGGRNERFDLKTKGGQWPVRVPPIGQACCARPYDLGLIGARETSRVGVYAAVRLKVRGRVSIAGRRGLLLEAAGYPNGGIHGGHLVAVWNQRGHGYVLSIHDAREDDLLEAAAAMSRS